MEKYNGGYFDKNITSEKSNSINTKKQKIIEIAEWNFFGWNNALLTKDPKKVAELYSEDNTFLPTVSGEFKKEKKGAQEYFKHFLEKNPIGKITQEEIQSITSNCYLHSGMYDFEIWPDNDRQIVEARFSFVWKKNNNGEWEIIHHHSSKKPQIDNESSNKISITSSKIYDEFDYDNDLTQQEIIEIAEWNFFGWNNALLTKDPKKVAELYSEDNTFLPTVSGEFKKGKRGAQEYFKHFLEKNPIGEIKQEEIQNITSNCYLHSGMYDFEVWPDNDRQIVEARFSFVWKKNNNNEWEIIHHHSSKKPQI